MLLVLLLFACLPANSVGQIQSENDDRYTQLLKRVENLEMRDAKQQVEIDFLRAELVEEKQETKRLKGIIQELRQELEDCEDTNTPAGHDGPEIKDIKTTHKNGGPRIRQATPEIVAFHSVLQNHLQNVGLKQNIAFDKVITNIGGAYNQHFGSFIAPVSGIYVFSTTIMGLVRDEMNIGILNNGVMVGQMHIRNNESPYETDSAMVVLQLHKGDDIAIQSLTNNIAINGNLYSMFSGFLLVPYE